MPESDTNNFCKDCGRYLSWRNLQTQHWPNTFENNTGSCLNIVPFKESVVYGTSTQMYENEEANKNHFSLSEKNR